METTEKNMVTWLTRGKAQGATHMIVVCDTFDWSDYPVYVTPEQDVKEEMKHYDQVNMQKIMEVYNLALPLAPQLKAHRAWNL